MMMTGGLVALAGLGLVAIDIVGLARGLALYPVSKQFGDEERRLARTRPIGRYSDLRKWPGEGDESYATRVGQAIGDHLIHSMGSEFPRVSIFQNWILWLLGVVVPLRFQFVEFRNARYALERGFGLCSQAALALADLLSRAHIPVAIAQLEGHVVVTAETAPGRWIVLDPDYGITIPMPLEEIQGDPAAVVAGAYGGRYGAPVVERVARVYAKGHRILPWGTARERARATLERLVFMLKWLVPLLLIGGGGLLAREGIR